jgi:hypothetical protein
LSASSSCLPAFLVQLSRLAALLPKALSQSIEICLYFLMADQIASVCLGKAGIDLAQEPLFVVQPSVQRGFHYCLRCTPSGDGEFATRRASVLGKLTVSDITFSNLITNETQPCLGEPANLPLYLATMRVSTSVGRLRKVLPKRSIALAETAQRASGSGRARSPLSLWDTKPVGEHKARVRYRSLGARTADRFEIAFARLGDREHA